MKFHNKGSKQKCATCIPTTADLHWAAGFLEGEGTFRAASGSACAEAYQVNREPLDKLQAIFGGRVRITPRMQPRQWIYVWWTTGPRARGIVLTLYSLLSQRRKDQVKAMVI